MHVKNLVSILVYDRHLHIVDVKQTILAFGLLIWEFVLVKFIFGRFEGNP